MTPAEELRAAAERLALPGSRLLVVPALLTPIVDLLTTEADVLDEMHAQCPDMTYDQLSGWGHGLVTVARAILGSQP